MINQLMAQAQKGSYRDQLLRRVPMFCSFWGAGSHWILAMLANSLYRGWECQEAYQLVRKTHHFRNISNAEKLVYLYRHGKDAILSKAKKLWRHHCRDAKTSEVFHSEFLMELLDKGIALDWKAHMDYFHYGLDRNSIEEVYYMTYEDMVKYPVKELEKLGDFLGYEDFNADVEGFLGSSPKDDVPGGVVVKGTSTAAKRLEAFTGRWKKSDVWTDCIDNMANDQIGNTLVEYGYND